MERNNIHVIWTGTVFGVLTDTEYSAQIIHYGDPDDSMAEILVNGKWEGCNNNLSMQAYKQAYIGIRKVLVSYVHENEKQKKDTLSRLENIKEEGKYLSSWKQHTPKMEFNALLGALSGEISNIEDGIAVTNAVERSQVWLNQLKVLGDLYLKKEW